MFTENNEIRSATRCLSYVNENLEFLTCDKSHNRVWKFIVNEFNQEGQLKHVESGLCLTNDNKNKHEEEAKPKMVLEYLANVVKNAVVQKGFVSLKPCSSDTTGQTWNMKDKLMWN